MSKIMVVEDDASLREIYSIRITAEGYEVISAGDGEEALAIAVREQPDLILSDIMMPKISGFDMLDILRSTPKTAKIKVIMMTALSAEDQRQRGERLGADRYLVKSQVGIEDVINAIHEVLGDRTPTPTPETAPTPAATSAPVVTPSAGFSAPESAAAPEPAATPESAAAPEPAATPEVTPVPEQASVSEPTPALEQASVLESPTSTPEPVPTAGSASATQPEPSIAPEVSPVSPTPQVNYEQPSAQQ